ncbi:hypothetical protein WK13_34825 [Burkholderia ubonensis]|uniref:hypothetical protein n=1 Tax=Burkholderia ubonensis TaxID=101571 RepID=UPI00075A3A99|nr:hypothetical protein [Burkholderia ubonensis]KVR21715.1 hypothetical protein WK13_34825 [Burkholderia ubonensis]
MDIRTYLTLETALIQKLRRSWQPLAASYYRQIADLLEKNDLAGAYTAAHAIDMTPVATKNREYTKYMLRACAVFGAGNANPNADKTFVGVGKYDTMLNTVADAFEAGIKYNATQAVVKAALQSIADWEAAQSKATKAERFLTDFVSFAQEGNDALKLASSLHSSRLATWGFTAEAELLGDDEYELTAVLDGRTSEFCRAINGKRFKLQPAREAIVRILSLDSPDAIKAAQPWPKQDKASMARYRDMSAAELTAAGLMIPPFHPFCRTMLIRAGVAPKLKAPTVTAEEQVIPKEHVDAHAFEELGVAVDDAELAHWNAYMPLSPVSVVAEVAGIEPIDVLHGDLMNKTPIKIDPKGDITVTTKHKLGKGTVASSVVLDPFTGTLYQSYIEFQKLSPETIVPFFKRVEQGILAVAQSAGAREIVVTATTAASISTYTSMGYAPALGDWYSVRAQLLDDLQPGGKLQTVAEALTPEQVQLVETVLSQGSVKGLEDLTKLAISVKGRPLYQVLLEGVELELSIDLADKGAIQKYALQL